MATERTVTNAAQIAQAQAAQQAAQAKVARAQQALSTAKAEAPTKAGASILSQGGDLSAARYTAMAAATPGALGPQSTLSVEAQTKPYQEALTTAQQALAGVNVPTPVYSDTALGQSAYDLLYAEFNRYGLASLVEPLKGLITENLSPAELTLRLQQTPAYQTRFSANAERIKKGLTALTPAEYIGAEDQYQNIMRQYGLPASYYTPDSTGKQSGFDQLLANDVSQAELEDRIMTAQSRVINANPEVKQALKQFYPDITDGDILAYTLDPQKALTDIKRKVTAAEIGGAALAQGLQTGATTAEQLASYGITKAQAQQGYSTIADILPTGQKLSQIYGESPYTQTQAEQEIFNLADSAAAGKKRKRLREMEQATFGGSSGTSGSALSRDRALSTQSYREPGAGAY